MYDTIIIGGGMSGLAAGIRLAMFDRRVCILEQHTTIGGLNSFYRLRGRNYDVGLHAMTNFTPRGAKRGPLARVLRQLRFDWNDFAPAPQLGSAIRFPQVALRFNNDPQLLSSQIAEAFPAERDRFGRLVDSLPDYDDLRSQDAQVSARARLGEMLREPLLVEMLLCPLMFYGSARENDIDFLQFCIMFRSIYLEGLARPRGGVRVILKQLVRRFRELGGELRLRAKVRRLALAGNRVAEVTLEDGTALAADQILSSAGWPETMRLCRDPAAGVDAAEPTERAAGRLSFMETICTLDCHPRELGHQEAVLFFNDSPRFHWRQPDDLVDVRSGVVCSPNNFAYPEAEEEGTMRVTALADYDRWRSLEGEEYRKAKAQTHQRMIASAVRFVPDFRPRVIDQDAFTPTTIVRFTGRHRGAVYGIPEKRWDGTTHLTNLFICGTDQGYVGIVGALMSGITMANRHVLQATD